MALSFSAVIRRAPGGKFQKVAKSSTMPAMPVHTTLDNLATYFQSWPKRKAEFLMYGPQLSSQRAFSTQAFGGFSKHKAATGLDGTGLRPQSACEVEMGVYGPCLSAPAEKKPEGGQAAPPAAARSLGLGGVSRKFKRGEKITMVTAYDFPSARVARGSGLELVLVGDSIGNCRLGLPDTVGVTMDDMVRATTSVRRGVDAPPAGPATGPKPVVVGDMPFGSYLQEGDALRNAAALRVAGAEMVKLEGGQHVAPLIRALTNAGIPVMGHVGLSPQSDIVMGGLKMQGTTAKTAIEIIKDAQACVSAGAAAVVVECVPREVARAVQAAVPSVPIIGIGAGGDVAGQVLVCDDLLGVHGRAPSFVKQYANFGAASAEAYASWIAEVRSGAFPGEPHMQKMKPPEWDELKKQLTSMGVELQGEEWPEPSLPTAFPAALNGIPTTTSGSLPADRGGLPADRAWRGLNGFRAPLGSPALSQMRSLSKVSGDGGPASGAAIQVLRTREQMHAWRQSVKKVAFVPTMGNLHEGHLELVDEAGARGDEVLVSIFVNPAQFAAHEDLDTYPRTFQRDLELLQARGVAAVFAPTPAEMYPRGTPGGVVVVPTFVQGKSEDACRPHFFTGVATVCLKLFNICQPDVVVFGQKDAMQCVVIRRMLEDLGLDSRIEMVVAPTSREEDGLARSSRNSYLTPDMRRRAPAIYAALDSATRAPAATAGSVRRTVTGELEAAGMIVSYVSVADATDMQEKQDGAPLDGSVVSVACLIREGDNECRLIDNVLVPAER